MRPRWLPLRRANWLKPQCIQRRRLLTLAIETSCDDTSVAVLATGKNGYADLLFHERITSDNRAYGGVHPIAAHESHQKNLSSLIRQALQKLPRFTKKGLLRNSLVVDHEGKEGTVVRQKPDFITVTRGPGMRASLLTGIDTAKGLAVAWQIPLLGVNHMQAHALTARFVAATQTTSPNTVPVYSPAFPFLTLLVSGGHTMLVHSKALCIHEILANTTDIAIGDMIDKCARDILPNSVLDGAKDVMYGVLLEKFAFPYDPKNGQGYKYSPPKSFTSPRLAREHGYDWAINPPYSTPGPTGPIKYADCFTYSGIGSFAKYLVGQRPNMDDRERRALAELTMTVAFEHLASRVLFALERPEMEGVAQLVVSGGVASNQFLKAILRTILDAKGYEKVRLVFPPPKFCTDNAAMIAWTGIEMYEAGWRTSLEATAVKKWAIDPKADDGGILGVDGWEKVESVPVEVNT
ncbi:uncharacterized protein L3040_006399 [Drepanopeziza brunnea f. sp. 'multigermtubi']|uniref:uncharacterized protein n=1 Tax=Drepanopeziza brunnea f. sp. 'multigermtubi' TaxID=698441 RepID=UPI0023A27AEC|nr:hypothetical protein L3040_006399 [Drepanopeziza brunnea f. sp. 'multigermtubi']